jgi:hypothetical protein
MILIMVVACGQRELAAEQYARWFADQDNGMVQKEIREVGSVQVEYCSPELVALREPGRLTIERVDAKRGAYYFNIKITPAAAPGMDDPVHLERSYYLENLVEGDLSLVIGKDTLLCAQSLHERTYGATPHHTLVASFLNDDQQANASLDMPIRLVINDRAFGFGTMNFDFEEKALASIPKLKV